MNEDCSEPIMIQKEVFGDEYQEKIPGNEAYMPNMYVLLYGEEGTPVGAAGMTYGLDGTILFSQLAVIPEERNKGYGDFIMHMMFDKCQLGQARYLKSFDITHKPEYFKHYGFEIDEKAMSLDIQRYFSTHHCHA